jgi:hypothetical protein
MLSRFASPDHLARSCSAHRKLAPRKLLLAQAFRLKGDLEVPEKSRISGV